MNQVFWIGVYPGLTLRDFVAATVTGFIAQSKAQEKETTDTRAPQLRCTEREGATENSTLL